MVDISSAVAMMLDVSLAKKLPSFFHSKRIGELPIATQFTVVLSPTLSCDGNSKGTTCGLAVQNIRDQQQLRGDRLDSQDNAVATRSAKMMKRNDMSASLAGPAFVSTAVLADRTPHSDQNPL